MTENLSKILTNRSERRNDSISWLFWHEYHSCVKEKKEIGPYKYRKKFMKLLCQKAGLNIFDFILSDISAQVYGKYWNSNFKNSKIARP